MLYFRLHVFLGFHNFVIKSDKVFNTDVSTANTRRLHFIEIFSLPTVGTFFMTCLIYFPSI